MSNVDPDIDGYPTFEAETQRQVDSRDMVRIIAYEAIQHYIEGGTNAIVTWVDTEDSWDGHALALCQPSTSRISMQYFHVNRERRDLIQRSRFELDISDINGDGETAISDEEDDLDALIDEAGLEFDDQGLLYTYAMLGKIALLEPHPTLASSDKVVMSVLYDDKLGELKELFPTAKKEKLPFTSDSFMEAIENLKELQHLEEGTKHIFLKKSFHQETYIMHLQFEDGELHYGIFIQGENEKWSSVFHYYAEEEPYANGTEDDIWDIDKLVKTVERGPAISQEAFELYFQDAQAAEMEDYHESMREDPTAIKRQTSEETQD